ncbi:restriction endonuclease subunit S [Calidithermus terrae]|nr:restriction endonuclease subunit S [Calidithermus terrae]
MCSFGARGGVHVSHGLKVRGIIAPPRPLFSLTEGGDFDKLGRGTVWNGSIPNCLHQNHIFRVRPNPRLLNSRFLAAIFASPYGKAYFLASAKQTTNLASINSTQLKAFPVPMPSLNEQERIAVLLDSYETRLKAEEAQLAKLHQLKRGLMEDLLTGRVRVPLAQPEAAQAEAVH